MWSVGNSPWAKSAWIAALTLLSAAYFYSAISVSAARNLRMDEVLVITTVVQPSWEEVWKVVWAGSDVSPPGYHYLLHGMAQLTGIWDSPFFWRIPSVLAFYGTGICTLAIALRYMSPFVSLAVVGLIFVSDLHGFSDEIRPYALLAFGYAAAFLLWDRYAQTQRRGLSAFAIWFIAAFCLSMHFYGFVLPAALGMAEVLWLITRRQFRWGIWDALVATIPVEALWWPLGRHLATFVADENTARAYYARPTLPFFKEALTNVAFEGRYGYGLFLTVVLVIGTLSVLRWLFPRRVAAEIRQEPYRLPLLSPLVIVILVTTPIPFLVFAFSYYVSGSFCERFLLEACIGYALAAGFILEHLPFRREAALALTVVCSWLLFNQPPDERPLSARLDLLPPSSPVVVADGRDYLDLYEVSDAQTRKSLFFLFNPPDFRSPDPTYENILKRMAPFLPGSQIQGMNQFLQAHPDFYVLSSKDQPMSAYAPWFFKGAWTRTLVRQEVDVSLYHASQIRD